MKSDRGRREVGLAGLQRGVGLQLTDARRSSCCEDMLKLSRGSLEPNLWCCLCEVQVEVDVVYGEWGRKDGGVYSRKKALRKWQQRMQTSANALRLPN